jgi:hypothetical protein
VTILRASLRELSFVELGDHSPHTFIEVCSTHIDKVEIKRNRTKNFIYSSLTLDMVGLILCTMFIYNTGEKIRNINMAFENIRQKE